MDKTTTKHGSNDTDGAAATVRDALDTGGRGIGEAAGVVRDAASNAADRVPEAAATARDLLAEADRQIRGGSDEMLAAGATLSTGIAVGLLVGGANRLLIALAILPALAMGITLLDRTTPLRNRARSA